MWLPLVMARRAASFYTTVWIRIRRKWRRKSASWVEERVIASFEERIDVGKMLYALLFASGPLSAKGVAVQGSEHHEDVSAHPGRAPDDRQLMRRACGADVS